MHFIKSLLSTIEGNQSHLNHTITIDFKHDSDLNYALKLSKNDELTPEMHDIKSLSSNTKGE